MTHFNLTQAESNRDPASEKQSLEASLTILREKAGELFENKERAAAFCSLLDDAGERLRAQVVAQGSAADLTGTKPRPESGSELDLQELARLVHAVVQLEDTIQDVRGAGDAVLDWLAKGGRSLGLD